MVGYITESTGGNYTPTPEGQHVMVCSRIIDLGTQPGSAAYPAPKRKVRIFWELPDERIEFQDGEGRKLEGPVLHSEQFTASFHEKATLRKTLESWRGRKFSQQDFSGPPDGFHLSKLIGIPALGQIIHEGRDGKTYANMNSIMLPPKAMFDQYKDKIEGAKIFFSLDDFEQEEFDKLSDRLKATISSSPEYQKIHGVQSSHDDPAMQRPAQDSYGSGGRPSNDLDDEIPFMMEWRA